MDAAQAFVTLGISLALGLLVGMQRERVKSQLAGFRTFGLITVLGTLSALIAQSSGLGGWIVAAGLLAISAVTVMANIAKMRLTEAEPGMTTEVATLVMFLLGAYLVYGPPEVAVVVGGAVAVLLYAKPVMHRFVERLGDQDMRAMMQLVLISLVILPVLPNKTYGPFGVLNPREIWWIVVLVVGISFGGYAALKLFGERAGAVVGGLLGGLVSSTATTVSYARRAAQAQSQIAPATLVIMLASTVVYVRLLVEVAVAARPVLPIVAGPIGIMLAAGAVLSVAVWLQNRSTKSKLLPQENPSELKTAIVFGAMYAVVLFAAAAAKHYFDSAGLYAIAGISGLTDMDAITLSTARMVVSQGLDGGTAWRAIIVAIIANLAFKAGLAGLLGGRKLFARIALLFGINILVGVGLLLFWPDGTAPGVAE